MLRNTLSATVVLVMSAFSFSAHANCTVGDYCIDFEDNDFVAHETVTGLSGSHWSQVMDDEYTGGNGFGDIEVEFWTSTGDTGAPGQYDAPSVLPDFDAKDYDELIQDDMISSNGYESAPYLVLFDTNASSTKDNDLEVGTSNGGSYTGGNIAVIHEEASSDRECETINGQDYCENADDRYTGETPHGGFVFVHFSEPVHVHSIDLVDIEDEEHQRGSIGFYDNANTLLANGMVEMEYDTGSLGNKTHGTQTFEAGIQNLSITTLVIRMQGSGGFDNIAFSKVTQVSEPGTLAIFAIGLLGLARLRKSR